MLTQIYEVSTLDEARSTEIGVDHIGILGGNGEFPRELSIERAATVAAGIVPPSKILRAVPDCRLGADRAMGARQLQTAILHLGAAPELLRKRFGLARDRQRQAHDPPPRSRMKSANSESDS